MSALHEGLYTFMIICRCILFRKWIFSHKSCGEYQDTRREEKLTRCHWMFYCTYNMLNMFRALLCPSSRARDYMCIITAYGVQCLVAGCRRSGILILDTCLNQVLFLKFNILHMYIGSLWVAPKYVGGVQWV